VDAAMQRRRSARASARARIGRTRARERPRARARQPCVARGGARMRRGRAQGSQGGAPRRQETVAAPRAQRSATRLLKQRLAVLRARGLHVLHVRHLPRREARARRAGQPKVSSLPRRKSRVADRATHRHRRVADLGGGLLGLGGGGERRVVRRLRLGARHGFAFFVGCASDVARRARERANGRAEERGARGGGGREPGAEGERRRAARMHAVAAARVGIARLVSPPMKPRPKSADSVGPQQLDTPRGSDGDAPEPLRRRSSAVRGARTASERARARCCSRRRVSPAMRRRRRVSVRAAMHRRCRMRHLTGCALRCARRERIIAVPLRAVQCRHSRAIALGAALRRQ
jgi:hypothetical protein